MWKIDQLIKDLNSNEINTNVEYQRGIVWDDEKQGYFINSCYKGIVPNPIILNKKYDDNDIQTTSCIDGKQRLTSILKYKNNEIYFEIDGNKIYFDKVPSEFENDENYRILTNREKQDNFLMIKMPVVEYKDLSYADEREIFNRIQHGTPLKSGELIPSLIDDPITTMLFNQFCDDKKTLFAPIKNIQRKDHINLIISTMHMVDTNASGPCKLTQKQKKQYFKEDLDTASKLNSSVNRSSKLIDVCFSTTITSKKYFKKLTDNQKLVVVYYIFDEYQDRNYNLKQMDYAILNASIKDFYNECKQNDEISNKSSDKMFEKLSDLFEALVNEYDRE
jgi:hypothetical protein